MIKQLLASLRSAVSPVLSGGALLSAPIAVAAAAADGMQPVAAAAIEAVAEAGKRQRVLLLPMGTIKLRDARGPFRLDDLAHAQAVVAASLSWAGGTDLVIDYDHQTFYSVGAGKGGTAKAAGWVKELTADAGGIWGEIEWTPAATAALQAGEYRYISPLFYPAADGRVERLANAGLVNVPAITDLPAVAAANQENIVDLSKIAAALGLAATATLDDILAAIAKMAAPGDKMMMPADKMMAAAAALGLTGDVTAEGIAAAAITAASAAPDPAKFVPVAVLTDANARLAVLEADRHKGLIAAATEAGKLSPAMLPWATALLQKDEKAFSDFVAAAPSIVAAGASLQGDMVIEGAHGLTASEVAIAASLSLTPEQFAAAKKDA